MVERNSASDTAWVDDEETKDLMRSVLVIRRKPRAERTEIFEKLQAMSRGTAAEKKFSESLARLWGLFH